MTIQTFISREGTIKENDYQPRPSTSESSNNLSLSLFQKQFLAADIRSTNRVDVFEDLLEFDQGNNLYDSRLTGASCDSKQSVRFNTGVSVDSLLDSQVDE